MRPRLRVVVPLRVHNQLVECNLCRLPRPGRAGVRLCTRCESRLNLYMLVLEGRIGPQLTLPFSPERISKISKLFARARARSLRGIA
jgi:hypothetical protein